MFGDAVFTEKALVQSATSSTLASKLTGRHP